MLKQRIITALVLLGFLLPALFYSEPWPFVGIALLFIVAGAWEWARLNGFEGAPAWISGAVCGLSCALAWSQGWLSQAPANLWLIAGACWVLGSSWILKSGVAAWAHFYPSLRLVAGLFALFLTWLAVGQAKVIGSNFLLSVLALVWTADVCAYFAGRAFGGRLIHRKLAASISPGKSWEGVLGGMLGVAILAWTWHTLDVNLAQTVPSLFSHLASMNGLILLIASIFLTAMSVVGDLIESLVKRSAGVKDSSGLLPGHGGVLDRIDALLPTLPLAMMLQSL